MRRFVVLSVSAALIAGSVAGIAPAPVLAEDVLGLSVIGQFVYVDAASHTQPIRFAKVEVCDYDGPWPFDCDHGSNAGGSTGWTGDDGRFDLTFSGGDLEGRPDVYVRVFSETAGGNVTLETGVALVEYCMATEPRHDYMPGAYWTLDVGIVSPDNARPCSFLGGFGNPGQEHAAWQQLQFLNEVHAAAQDLVGSLPDVSIVWPFTLNGVPFYTPALAQIRMVPGREDERETLYHEYGHHVMSNYAESPVPDYGNKVCDETNPLRFLPFFGGHCFWRAERGSIHWTEGFPDFWAEVAMKHTFPGTGPFVFGVDTDDDGEADENVDSENPYLADGTSPSAGDPHEFVEAWTHIILRDLWDGSVDNHDAAVDANGASESDSADRVQLGFNELWDVILTDPDPADIFHDHPTTLLEFRELLVAAHPDLENRINAVFTENGIFQPGADLGVRDVTASATTVVRGQSITVSDTTFNDAAALVGTGEESRTGYYLKHEYDVRLDVDLAFRVVPSLGPGAGAAGSQVAIIPTTAEPGRYRLVTCADAEHKMYESRPPGQGTSMAANCAYGPQVTILNRVPVAEAGGPYTFAEGAGGMLDGSASSDPDGDTLGYEWSGDILAGPTDAATVSIGIAVDDGIYEVSLRVSDAYGGTSTDSVKVVVANVPPKVDAGDDLKAYEGDTVTRTVAVADPVDTSFAATVDWGDGAGPVKVGDVGSSFVVEKTFNDDAAVTVEVCANDGDDTACDAFTVNVANVAPVLTDDPIVVSGIERTALEGAARFTDPGKDAWIADLAWGDGESAHKDPLAGRSVPIDHAYAQEGSYVGSVCVADDDGGSDCAALQATIMSVAEAAANMIDGLRGLASSDPAIAAAIAALDGSTRHAASGALDKILAGDWVAAVGKLGEAVTALDAAQGDQSATQAILTRIAEGIARERMVEVVARNFTSKGATKQVASIRSGIEAGRRLYLAGSYRAAIDRYKVATQAAMDLLRTR